MQSWGKDVGLEIIQQIWPNEDPFQVGRHELLKALKEQLGMEARDYNFNAYADSKAIFQYKMHTLPDEIADSIGTSTLFAAWNAAVYVAQIEDQAEEGAGVLLAQGREVTLHVLVRALLKLGDSQIAVSGLQ